MTLFEYISVAFSIVLSFAAVRLLAGLSVSLAAERRYLPHSAWIAFVLVLSAMVWWNFWSFREVSWNFFSFLFVLLVPASIYLQAVALVPESPGRVESWRAHFFAARQRFFFSLASFFLIISVGTWLLLGLPLTHPARAFQATALGLTLAGAVSDHPRLHMWLPLFLTGMMVFTAGAIFSRPGAMAEF